MKKTLMALMAIMTFTMGMSQTVVSQACEQSIVTPLSEGRYLWLPIEEKAPEGKVQVIVNGILQMEQNVRMAREQVDYYVALDLQPYQGKGSLRICVQNVPTGSLCFSKLAQNNDVDFALINEQFRPIYHHTPKRGWMNDPNGMFYKDGVWNLYYQYNPYGSMWGNMHWGHSTTTDLIHWKDEGVAIAPDIWGTIFSGSCVVDKETVVAMYTSSRPTPFGGDVQAQSLAFSTDGGQTFTKFEGNPVLTAEEKDFRDLGLFDYAGETYLSVVPSKEMLAMRGVRVKKPTEACEIVVDLKGKTEIVLSNTKGEQVTMTYDASKQTFAMDRTKSGNVGFSEDFPCVTEAPTYGKVKQLRIFIDRCSIEAFDSDGKMAMTNLVFPSVPYDKIQVKGGKATIYNLNIK